MLTSGTESRVINDRPLRYVLGPHPSVKPLYVHGGNGKSYIEKQIEEKIAEDTSSKLKKDDLKIEWGPPMRIYYAEGTAHPECLCQWEAEQMDLFH